MDPLAEETAEFWKPHGEFNDVDPAKIQTEVFRLPTTCFAEERGSLVSVLARAAVALARRRAAGPGAQRPRDHVRAVPAHEEDVPDGRRQVPRSDPQPDLALRQAVQPDPGRTRDGVQRQGAGRRHRSEGPDQGAGQEGRTAGQLRAVARRRQHHVGCWIFAGSWTAGGQPDGPPRQQRPDRHRQDPELGLGLAGQPPRAVQPRLLRHRRASRSIRSAS
jgi:formate dehydrogenase major subunit